MVYGYIYKIENLVNGKLYIGQTIQKPNIKLTKHFNALKHNKHRNQHLQHSYNKYGKSNFKFSIINWCNSLDELNKLEMYYIKVYDTLNRGYNMTKGGDGQLSHYHTEETKRKLSEMNKGKCLSSETRKLVSENNARYWLGKSRSLESRKKMSKSRKGKQLSHNHCKSMSMSQRGLGKFGFTGTIFNKNKNPEKLCWSSHINYKGVRKFLGLFNDPLSAQLIHELVWDEIYNN